MVVDVDLEKFFDRVNHDILMQRLARRIADQAVLGLIRRYLQAGVAAKGAEQDAGRLFDLGQLDGGLRVMAARSLGDPVMPDLADEFFHGSDFPTGLFVGV